MAAPDPANLALVRNFGFVLLAATGIALWSGTAYFRGVIRRDVDPSGFWTAVGCQGFLGAFCVVGSLVAG